MGPQAHGPFHLAKRLKSDPGYQRFADSPEWHLRLRESPSLLARVSRRVGTPVGKPIVSQLTFQVAERNGLRDIRGFRAKQGRPWAPGPGPFGLILKVSGHPAPEEGGHPALPPSSDTSLSEESTARRPWRLTLQLAKGLAPGPGLASPGPFRRRAHPALPDGGLPGRPSKGRRGTILPFGQNDTGTRLQTFLILGPARSELGLSATMGASGSPPGRAPWPSLPGGDPPCVRSRASQGPWPCLLRRFIGLHPRRGTISASRNGTGTRLSAVPLSAPGPLLAL